MSWHRMVPRLQKPPWGQNCHGIDNVLCVNSSVRAIQCQQGGCRCPGTILEFGHQQPSWGQMWNGSDKLSLATKEIVNMTTFGACRDGKVVNQLSCHMHKSIIITRPKARTHCAMMMRNHKICNINKRHHWMHESLTPHTTLILQESVTHQVWGKSIEQFVRIWREMSRPIGCQEMA